MNYRFITLLIAAAVCLGCGGGATSVALGQVVSQGPLPPTGRTYSYSNQSPSSPHVVLIVEENRSYSSVYPLGMPWLSQLGDKYGIATNYYSDESGSLLDYLWLSSGSGEHVYGCKGGGCTETITDDNIYRQLIKAGKSWRVYADALPNPGFLGP